jgi:carbamate kinase
MRVLIDLGGAALLGRGGTTQAAEHAEAAARSLAAVAAENETVIAHSVGSRLGGMLELGLRNALPDREVVTVLSQIAVSADAADLSGDSGQSTSLEPHAIIELRSLRTLLGAGALVICACAGGASIAVDDAGTMRGIDAAIDRDLTAALLARRLDADFLLLLTDIHAVHLGWGFDYESALGSASPAELRKHGFAPDSMGLKVEAACRFVEATGHRAAIGALTDAVQIVRGAAGTQITPPRA